MIICFNDQLITHTFPIKPSNERNASGIADTTRLYHIDDTARINDTPRDVTFVTPITVGDVLRHDTREIYLRQCFKSAAENKS